MAMANADVERHFAVGLAATIQSLSEDEEEPRHKTCIRGWQRGQYVLLDKPLIGQRYVDLLRDKPCAVRFLTEGVACGFDAQILDLGPRTLVAHLYVSWPNTIQAISVRKHERIATSIPCEIRAWPNGVCHAAEMLDLSAGGCSLLAPIPLKPESTVSVTCVLPDGTVMDNVTAKVCRTRPKGEKYIHGCRFEKAAETIQTEIQFFVADTLERTRTPQVPGRRILLLEQREEVIEAISGAVQKKGYELVTATGVVDAFYRLRMVFPGALLLNQKQDQLSGIEICRIVKGSPGFQSLPVFIYGDNGVRLEAEARKAGAVGYFPTATLVEHVSRALASPRGTPKAAKPQH